MAQCAGGFACQCSICTGVVRVERRTQVALTVSQDDMHGDLRELVFEGIPRDFEWLMRSLLPESDKVKGCELIFPDTVFFKKGKPVLIIKSDMRDYCLQGVTHPKKLSLQSIYKDFQNVVRRRKKDNTGPFGKIYQSLIRHRASRTPSENGMGSSFNVGSRERSKEASLKRNDTSKKTHDLGATGGSDLMDASKDGITEKSIHYKDVALIRERILPEEVHEVFDGHKQDILRIVNDTGFMKTFQYRAAHEYWHSVIYIQTNVKSKIGCGTPIVVKFRAPLKSEDLDQEIVYDY